MKKEIDLGHGLYKYVEVEEQSVSQQLQDELEPIIHTMSKGINAAHPTQHDESDDIEESKKTEGELTEFEKAELKKRSVWGDKEWHFFKGEKWEWKI